MRRRTALAKAVGVLAVVAFLAGSCGSVGPSRAPGEAGVSGAAGSGAGDGGAPAGSPGPPLRWANCSGSRGPDGYECATLGAPLDPAHPGPSTIALGLARAPAEGHSEGVILVNPGGPGVSAVDALPGIVDMIAPKVAKRFDIVAFDPPGVGHSTPITCLDNAALGQYLHVDPAGPGSAGLAAVVASDAALGAACRAHSGAILGHVSTLDAARDMDLVRKALRVAKVNYVGFSYGTSLGAAYAELFGSHIRAMVLDGAIDPSVAALPFLQAQANSLDAQFRRFASACQASPLCSWRGVEGRGGDLVAAFQSLVSRVRAHPIPVGDRTVGPSELFYGTVADLYSTQSWPAIQEGLAAAEQGDGRVLLDSFDQYVGRSADGTYDNTFEAESAVNCLDGPAPTAEAIAAAQPGFAAAAPIFGTSVLYGELSCSAWPVAPTSAPHVVRAPQAPAIVVVGSTGDPVTPYAGAKGLASQLDHGVLLTRTGDGHTGYGASACIRSAVDAYLTELAVPPPGKTCASDKGS